MTPPRAPAGGGTKKAPSGAEIQACNCKNSFQDERYGRGMRVKNRSAKGLRCTVCLVETT